MIFTIIPNHATQSALNIATDVITSFIIYHLPFTVAVISSITTSRRQPEHFLKLSCQRMGIIFTDVHPRMTRKGTFQAQNQYLINSRKDP